MNLGRICTKTNHHSGGVATKIPDGFTNHTPGSPRQTIKVGFRVVEAFAFDTPVTHIGPLDCG
jgi:hypothetical protein